MDVTDWISSLPTFWAFVYCLFPSFVLYSWLVWQELEGNLPKDCFSFFAIISPLVVFATAFIMVLPGVFLCIAAATLSPILPWGIYKLLRRKKNV